MPQATATAPILDIDPFGLEALENPHAVHEAVREGGPVVWIPKYGIHATGRFADTRDVLMDPETYCSGAGVGLTDLQHDEPWRAPSLLLEADPPDHTRARKAITTVLTTATVRSWRERFERDAETIVDRLVARGRFDAIHDFAHALPLTTFADLIGLPAAGRRENLLPYGEMVGNALGPHNELFTQSVERAASVRAWIDGCCRRDRLSPDGIGVEIFDAARSTGYDADSAALIVRSVLSAGIDTTVNALGNAMLAFTEHPDAWEALHADPGLARAAFDEAIRYDTPLQHFFRTTTRPAELGGIEIPARSKILLLLGAANRDPRQWPHADAFDITRSAAGHVGFGFGIHHCVGRAVARMEGEVILAALARRVASISLAAPAERLLNNTIRGLRRLPVVIRHA
jgi:4-methoxybenzoate monooxygenase (O-demethylating)